MDLIDVVAQLKELEARALPGPWLAEKTIETNATGMRSEARYFSAMRIGTDAERAWHDRVFMADIGEWADLNLVIQLRNASPALLEVLGAFQPGDAQRLARFEDEGEYGDPVLQPEDIEMFGRLLAAARKMESD
jgi:hypothetical protein